MYSDYTRSFSLSFASYSSVSSESEYNEYIFVLQAKRDVATYFNLILSKHREAQTLLIK